MTYGGTAGVTGTSAAFVAGVLSSASVTAPNGGNSLTVTVNDGSGHTGSQTIATINLIYHYRTAAGFVSGNWSDFNTWEYSTDGGSTWTQSTSTTPDSTSDTIEIRTGNVAVDAATLTVDQVTIDATATVTVNSGNVLTIATGGLTVAANGTLACAGTGAININASSTLVNNGTVNYTSTTLMGGSSSGSFTQGANATFNFAGASITPALTATASGNTVNYTTGTGQTVKPTTYVNLTFSGSGAMTSSSSVTVTGNLTMKAAVTLSSSPTYTGAGALIYDGVTMTVGKELVANAPVTLQNGSVISLAGSNFATTGNFTVGVNCTFDTTVSRKLTVNTPGILDVSGTYISRDGSSDGTTGTGSCNIESGGVFQCNDTHTTLTIASVTVKSGGIVQVLANTTVPTATWQSGSELQLKNNGTLLGTGMAQTFDKITVNSAGTVTLPASAAPTVNNTLTITAGALADGGNTITAKANVSNFGTHTGAGKISLTGGSAQHQLSGTGAYSNLELNDANGAAIASGTSTINGTLTLTTGTFSNAGSITMAAASTISRATGSLDASPTFGASVKVTYTGSTSITTGNEIPSVACVLSILTANNTGTTGVTLGGNVTINGASAVGASGVLTVPGSTTLEIASGGTLVVNASGLVAVQSGGILKNSGAASDITSTATTLTLASTAIYQHNPASGGGTIPTAGWNANSTCAIIGALSSAPGGLAQTFGNFTWDTATQSANIGLGLSASTFNVGGTLTMNNSGSSKRVSIASTGSPTISVGNLVVSGGELDFTTGAGIPVVTVTGNVTLSGGGILAPVNGGTSASLNVGGNWANSGTFTSAGSTVTFNGTAAQSIGGSGITTFNNVTIANTAQPVSLGINETVSGTLTVNASANLDFNSMILTTSHAPVLNGGLTMEVTKSGSLSGSQLAQTAGALTYGGTLTVNLLSGTLASGDTVTLFSSTRTGHGYSGYFSSVTVPAVPSGTSWDTNDLRTAGVLDIYPFTTTSLTASTPMNTAAVIAPLKLANHVTASRASTLTDNKVTLVTTPSHGSASVSSGVLTYTPTGGYTGSDSFTCTFQDGHGWQTMAVSATVGSGTGQSPNAVYTGTSGGNFVVNFAGIPGDTYTVESGPSASGPWTKLANYTAPSDNGQGFGIGVFQVSDPMSNGAGFYRTVYPSY